MGPAVALLVGVAAFICRRTRRPNGRSASIALAKYTGIAFASAGPTLVGLVLGSHAQGRLTASEVSDLLGIRLKHLPKIRQALLDRTAAVA